MTSVAIGFLIVGIPTIIYVLREIISITRNSMTLEEALELIDTYGHMGYVSTEVMLARSKIPPAIEETPEEVAAYKAWEEERDAKRAEEKKKLGFVETECPMCECKFLTRRVRDDHILEE